MTAPVFVVAPAVLRTDRVVIEGREGHHAADVRRLRVGEAVQLTDGAGARGHGRVARVERGRLEVDVLEVEHEPPPDPRFVVVQALVKQDAAEAAVTTMTEVGVDEIVPWAARRSVVAWEGDRAEKGRRRWCSAAEAAAKQARRAWVPPVASPASTADVVGRVAAADLAVVLDADGSVPLGEVSMPRTGQAVVVVGPEGGLASDEVDAFTAVGAVTARLGPSVLRSATAGTVAAAVLLSRSARWTSTDAQDG